MNGSILMGNERTGDPLIPVVFGPQRPEAICCPALDPELPGDGRCTLRTSKQKEEIKKKKQRVESLNGQIL
jgi:hypothetical protein